MMAARVPVTASKDTRAASRSMALFCRVDKKNDPTKIDKVIAAITPNLPITSNRPAVGSANCIYIHKKGIYN